jgi:hypothetical protein
MEQTEKVTNGTASADVTTSNLRELADLIELIHEAGDRLVEAEIAAFTKHVRLYISVGEFLNEAKDHPDIPHGEFIPWFKARNFPFSLRTAQRAMLFAKRKEELEAWTTKTPHVALLVAKEDLTIRKAERLLRKKEDAGKKPKPPPKKQSEVKEQPAPPIVPDKAPSEDNPPLSDDEVRLEAREAEQRLKKAKAKAKKTNKPLWVIDPKAWLDEHVFWLNNACELLTDPLDEILEAQPEELDRLRENWKPEPLLEAVRTLEAKIAALSDRLRK